MWNQTVSSSDKQNIEEVGDVNDCKCSGEVEQFEEQQQQKDNSKQQMPRFGGQLSGSAYVHQKENGEEGGANRKLIDLVSETTDSGFISGPQTSSSANLDTDNEAADIESCEIYKSNTRDSSNESEVHKKTQQQELQLDSGIIEEEYDESGCDLKQQKPLDEPKMLLPHSVESGLSEWFCNLSLQSNSNSQINPSLSASGTVINNLDAPRQQRKISYVAGSTIPQQIHPSNAWRKCYQQDDDGDTSLHLACISGNEDVVTALIRMAPHPCLFNIRNDDVYAPLHLATLTAQPKIIRMLLIAGANPTVRDHHGNTPLHLACISGEEQCVRALTVPISASEVKEAHRQYGHRTTENCYLQCAQLPSDLEIKNYDGEKCVHLAAQAGFINILRILVFYGADINAKEGKGGYTPLHIAIERCNAELVNYLLGDCQKLDIETETYAGLTAYQMACVLKKLEMLNILEKGGAEPLSPPESDYDSDIESDLDEAKFSDRFGDPGYFVGYKGGNVMTVA